MADSRCLNSYDFSHTVSATGSSMSHQCQGGNSPVSHWKARRSLQPDLLWHPKPPAPIPSLLIDPERVFGEDLQPQFQDFGF